MDKGGISSFSSKMEVSYQSQDLLISPPVSHQESNEKLRIERDFFLLCAMFLCFIILCIFPINSIQLERDSGYTCGNLPYGQFNVTWSYCPDTHTCYMISPFSYPATQQPSRAYVIVVEVFLWLSAVVSILGLLFMDSFASERRKRIGRVDAISAICWIFSILIVSFNATGIIIFYT